MFKTIRAEDRHFNNYGWLQTNWLFSFDDYYDPSNLEFGVLRVFNDDTVQPDGEFPPHPHREMEIITIVLDGALTHTDTAGEKMTIGPNEVQRISAGWGVRHSEMNGGEKPVHHYQIWFYPRTPCLRPSYEHGRFSSEDCCNRLLPIASGSNTKAAVMMNADASLYMGSLDKDKQVTHQCDSPGRVFIYVASGKVEINGHELRTKDQVRITNETSLDIRAMEKSEIVLIDMPTVDGLSL